MIYLDTTVAELLFDAYTWASEFEKGGPPSVQDLEILRRIEEAIDSEYITHAELFDAHKWVSITDDKYSKFPYFYGLILSIVSEKAWGDGTAMFDNLPHPCLRIH